MNDLDRLLSKVKTKFLMRPDSIFIASICTQLDTVWDDTIPLGAVDGIKLYLNPNEFPKLSSDEQIFLLAHETLHVAYSHMLRLEERDKHIFNMAADYVINLELSNQGYTLIDNCLIDDKYTGMSTEQVYELLIKDAVETKGNYGIGNDIIPNTEEVKQQIDEILLKASHVATMTGGAGNIPNEITRYLQELTKPKVNWKVALRRFITDFDVQEVSWKRPKKRYLPMYLPTKKSLQLSKLTIAIDVSGSVTDKQFQQFIAEIRGIFRQMKPKQIEVIQFDTDIISTDDISCINQLISINFKGGGGTLINPVINHVNNNDSKGLIVITDGFFWETYAGNIPVIKCNKPVLWVIQDNPSFKAEGQIIHIEGD